MNATWSAASKTSEPDVPLTVRRVWARLIVVCIREHKHIVLL